MTVVKLAGVREEDAEVEAGDSLWRVFTFYLLSSSIGNYIVFISDVSSCILIQSKSCTMREEKCTQWHSLTGETLLQIIWL